MRRPAWMGSTGPPRAEKPVGSGAAHRGRIAWLLALATVLGIGVVFVGAKGLNFLMPGQLASVHGGIEKCSTCHSKSGTNKVSWLHGLAAGDRHGDSKACLTCHKMPDTALNAHGAAADVLKQSTMRLTKIAAQSPAPSAARAQNTAFPMHDMVANGLNCASCHQEHQGLAFNLNKVSNEQCRSCHVVKFDSFDGMHPKFDSYPFKRRTRIVYDHAGHFGKHYPEVAKKDPTKRIPETCSTCHDSRDDKRVMAVVPFDKTCSGCHLNQITGKERATGPKGIAFLSVPGLDLQTLGKKNAAIGEWPEDSDARLTPFMKVMIARNARGEALVKTLDGLNLQDLSKANDDQIKAVAELAWEIKGLFHALIKGKASDVLGDLKIGGGAKLSAGLVADLTASIPRDVVVSAQQEWLPNLGAEMANRPTSSDPGQTGGGTVGSEKKLAATASPEELFGPVAGKGAPQRRSRREIDTAQAEGPAGKPKSEVTAPDDGEETPSTDEQGRARVPLPSGTPRSIEERSKSSQEPDTSDGAAGRGDRAKEQTDDKAAKTDSKGSEDRKPDGASGLSGNAESKPDAGKAPASEAPPQGDPGNQSDDLLFPTEEEQRAMKSGGGGGSEKAAGAAKPDAAAPKDGAAKASADPSSDVPAGENPAPAAAQAKAAPVVSIGSDVDPESWAEYGGWYRQDFAIFYRPTGHKDKFIYSWLFLTGPLAPKGDKSPAAAVFDGLIGKEAQGVCTKCHSIDDIPGKGRLVNFSPPSVETKRGRFTAFIHEPHFGIMENRGCLTCHNLEKGREYLKSFEQGDARNFVSNFGAVKKDLCQGCHNSSMARQDCSLCHKYHVNGVVTPIINTKLPVQ